MTAIPAIIPAAKQAEAAPAAKQTKGFSARLLSFIASPSRRQLTEDSERAYLGEAAYMRREYAKATCSLRI